ncbi:gamma-crystallin M3-like isoform X2 [Oryzias latipes]|uniref:gamma-crystallin M3-like isoform X2 n=1 Tax=Oryzias latipes TaxID=8090 RepID=UPI0002A4A8A4|nr:gamma-crystallin M3-like isoform X2 [Oryzias latipes]
MGRILFYEDRNFQGRSYECSSDCADVHLQLSRCNSCRVDSGCFVVYERPSFTGNQIFLRRGEYPDFQRMGSALGMTGAAPMETVRSCRVIPMHSGQFLMRIYERENFGGRMQELMEDCQSLQERYSMSDCQSCNVTDGHWLLFEQPGFRGRMVYLRPGEYRSLRDASTSNITRCSSARRVTDAC